MRGLRNRKGFSIIELLIVLVILALVMLLISMQVIRWIDEARGTTATASARTVLITAQGIMAENLGTGVVLSDREWAEGLSGTVDNPIYPVQTRLSQRMNTLLAPDVELSDEPGDGKSTAYFEIEDGRIVSLTYEAAYGSRVFAVTMVPGEEAVVERIK